MANPNRLDNGDMWVDQHNSGASVAITTAGEIVTDRWQVWNSALAKFTAGQNYSVATKAPGFQYFLGVQTTGTGAAPTAAAVNMAQQAIEYDTFSDFQWGTANAQPATLSFWVNSSLTGNFSVALSGQVSPFRVFITTYNIPTANTWTKITIPIPADTTVSSTNWTGAGNAIGLTVFFDLGCGSTYQTSTSLGAWQNSATAVVATGAVKLVATSNAKWAVTGVKLELGSVATAWLHEDLAKSYARCQRYLQSSYVAFSGGGSAGGVFIGWNTWAVQMRAAPTLAYLGPSYGNASGLASNNVTPYGNVSIANVTLAGSGWAQAILVASAEI